MANETEIFSWYPGHIAKAEHELRDKWLPLVDVVIELVDSRLPITSRYPDRSLFAGKGIVTVYTKGDLSNLGPAYFSIDVRRVSGWRKRLRAEILRQAEPVLAKLSKQGRQRKLRIGICGLPNVGKSTFLNSFWGGRKKAQTGNLPGVTRQMQFVSGADFDLLDSPGLCPVRIPQDQAYKLALCNLLPEKLFDKIDLANKLLGLIHEHPSQGILGLGTEPLPQVFRREEVSNIQEAQLVLKAYRNGQLKVSLDCPGG